MFANPLRKQTSSRSDHSGLGTPQGSGFSDAQTLVIPVQDMGEQSKWAALFVWGTWALMLSTALTFLGRYSHDIPWCDDWEFVPYLTGERPITLSWLWQQDKAEHRLFLMKGVSIVLLKLSGGDFRTLVFFNTLAMGGIAFAMIRVATRLRGWISYPDAFFPLALLAPPFSESASYLGEHIFYVLPTLVVSTLLLIMVQRGIQLTLGTGILAGACLILLPLCAGIGVLYMPFLTLWLAYSGILAWRSSGPHAKRNSAVILGLTLAALLLLFLYFFGYQRAAHQTAPDGSASVATSLRANLKASLALSTLSFSAAAAKSYWPFSGIAMFVLIAVGTVVLVVAAFRSDQVLVRSRAIGLLFFMSAIGMLALAFGYGRANMGLPYIFGGYSFLSVPVVCSLYFVWVIYKPQTMGYFMQMLLFTILACTVLSNIEGGREDARGHSSQMSAFERELNDGAPAYALVAHHWTALTGTSRPQDETAEHLHMLQRAGRGPFRSLAGNPTFRQVTLPLTPIEVNEVEWRGGLVRTHSSGSYVTFALPEPCFVGGIRIRFSHPDSRAPKLRVFWRRRGETQFPENPGYECPYGQVEDPLTIYIADTVDRIRIYPDTIPCQLDISGIVLLVPDAKAYKPGS